jgi:hypothetical protein
VKAEAVAQVAQVLLRLQYQELARRSRESLPELADVEFRCYSQNGEDGILLYLFSLLGTTDRRAVELCAGDGIECNAANLILNHRWQGLLVDSDPELIERGRAFYAQSRDVSIAPPTLAAAWLTAENVDAFVSGQGFAGELDLLSLDLDGNDYWIWRALNCVSPRVVVLEFNNVCGPERAISIPYDPEFRFDFSVVPYPIGASLSAFGKLGQQKGYRLVGVDSFGINAFFVRDGLAEELLPTLTPEECYEQAVGLRGWKPADMELLLAQGQWVEV